VSAVAAAAAAIVVAVSPNPSHLGSLVTVTVEGAGTPSFAPFTVRRHHGHMYVLQCVEPACVPGSKPQAFVIGGKRISIVPRATAAQVQHPARSFRRATTPPPYSYRISPNALRTLTVVLAVLLILIAAAALYPYARRHHPDVRDERTALDLLRESLRRGPDDRRRALDFASRVVAQRDEVQRVLDLAWSEPEPDPHAVEEVVATLERTS
jgi:hypothetical protein